MTKSQMFGARLGFALLAAGLIAGAAPAAAQTGNPALDSRGDALSRNLRSLSENPKSVTALMGAGKAALQLGDPQAAITFFGRAEEQAPRDGRIKMWLGSALVHLQQAQGALKFFAEAMAFGVPEAEVAGQRGLAYDLLGDPRRAQRDYRLALQAKPDAEVSRNLALSLAISGEREAALEAIEDQLLIRDRAAERTRAFVLALTGDAAGANRAVQASMPAQSAALAPFLQRLPALSVQERALAVHFGHFPTHARNLPVPPANSYAALDPAVATRAGAPDSRQKALGTRESRTVTRLPTVQTRTTRAEQKQQPASAEKPKTKSSGQLSAPVRAAQQQVSPPAVQQPTTPTPAASKPGEPVVVASPTPSPAQQQPTVLASNQAPASNAVSQPPVSAPTVTAQASPPLTTPQAVLQSVAKTASPEAVVATPGFSLSAQPVQLASAQKQEPISELASVEQAPAPAAAPVEEKGASRLADIASLIASLPESTPAATPAPAAAAPVKKPAPAPAKAATVAPKKEAPPKTQVAAGKTPAKPAAKKETVAEKKPAAKPAAPAEPKRIWVQVAGGADKAALPREFSRLKTKAPKLLAAKTAWTTPLKATNRLLVGPFKTDAEAQSFVNDLKKASLTGFAWTSDPGQKIEKLSNR
ncbi:MAG TPA: tetratricopeptide repeat protein [Allosphingosinicella sp.]